MEKFILWCIGHGLDVIVKYDCVLDNIHFVIFNKKVVKPHWRNDSYHVCIDMCRFKEFDEESKSNIFDEVLRTTKEYFDFEE